MHQLKADSPIEITPVGISIEVKLLQPPKARAPIVSSLLFSSKATAPKPLQPEKAEEPIEVTLEGISIEVKPLQPLKASEPIEVTLDGIEIEVKLLQSRKALLPIFVPPVITTVFKLGGIYVELSE